MQNFQTRSDKNVGSAGSLEMTETGDGEPARHVCSSLLVTGSVEMGSIAGRASIAGTGSNMGIVFFPNAVASATPAGDTLRNRAASSSQSKPGKFANGASPASERETILVQESRGGRGGLGQWVRGLREEWTDAQTGTSGTSSLFWNVCGRRFQWFQFSPYPSTNHPMHALLARQQRSEGQRKTSQAEGTGS